MLFYYKDFLFDLSNKFDKRDIMINQIKSTRRHPHAYKIKKKAWDFLKLNFLKLNFLKLNFLKLNFLKVNFLKLNFLTLKKDL